MVATFHGDTRIGPDDRERARLACSAIRTWSGGRINFTIRWDLGGVTLLDHPDEPRLIVVTEYDPRTLEVDKGVPRGYGAMAWTNPPNQRAGTPTIIGLVEGRTSASERYGVFLHEFLHAAGFQHVKTPGSVMYWAGTVNDFSTADRAECLRLRLCDPPK